MTDHSLDSAQISGNASIMDALNGIRDAILSFGGIYYPQVANGPVEQVLAFNNNEFIVLEDSTGKAPYFSSHGPLTDLQHRVLPGTKVETTFPIEKSKLGESSKWPGIQIPPFDKPPLDFTNATNNGYSKQAYFFDDGKSTLVTVGPSTPKIAPLKNGGAQFWVCSGGMLTQGTGRFEGMRGASVYLGSGYLPVWPVDSPDEQVKVLAAGFKTLVTTFFKLVPKDQRAS